MDVEHPPLASRFGYVCSAACEAAVQQAWDAGSSAGPPPGSRRVRSRATKAAKAVAACGAPSPEPQPVSAPEQRICPVEQHLLHLREQLHARFAERQRLHDTTCRLNLEIDQLREQIHDGYDTKAAECDHAWTPSPRTTNRVCTRCLTINDGERDIGSAHWSRA